ncbi:MAG: hypothetical protein KJO07_12495 [Deltaproteobacteria bacterium]|nr:hypothetical protein [Deltaproteobacteria bacterium]
MKHLAPAVLLSAAILATSTADARPRARAKSFQANKSFGLGLMLGAPAGLSAKYYLGADTALDFGLGVYERFGNRFGRYGGLHFHMDFLWHPVNLVSTPAFELPLYFGIGGRLWDHDDYDDDRYRDDTHLGVRAPIGIAFDFNQVPIDVFIELALVIDIVVDDARHDGFSDFNGAVGIRYYF